MASWNHDGTQDPGPPPLLADPLSGLVTGGKYDAEAVRIRVVEPAMPDIEAVREAMASVLDEDSELMVMLPSADAPTIRRLNAPGGVSPAGGVPGPLTPADGGGGTTAAGPGAGPAPASVTGAAAASTPPAGIPVVPPGRRTTVPADIPLPRGRVPRRPPRRSVWSPGLAAVGLLLLVMAVLVIVMLASLIDAISSLFG
jgi:hypothetical protein